VTIEHVLFDADGVLQRVPGGWVAAAEPYLGGRADAFLRETWREELPLLAGQGGDYLAFFDGMLRRYDVAYPVEEVYRGVWLSIEVQEASLELVRRVRAGGYGVHLGTNQDSYRAAYMRAELGYAELFDTCHYSCELGVAKPEPGFFDAVVERVGASPETVLFVDDTARNVEGARAAGLAAVRWEIGNGLDALRALFQDHGVLVG